MAVEIVAVISDVHFPHTHLATWQAFRAWHADVRPSRTIILGDGLDLPMVSDHPPEVEEGLELLPPIRNWAKQLKELKQECGRLDIVEGNHEARLYKKLIQPLAYQLKGMEHLVGLEALVRAHGLPQEVNWYVENPPTPTLRVGQFVLRHGHKQSGRFGGGVMPARAIFIKEAHKDWSALFGHYHRPQTYFQGDRCYAINPHMEADVKFTGGTDGWMRGWSYFELDTDREWATIHQLVNNHGYFVHHGKVYDGNDEDILEGSNPYEGMRVPSHFEVERYVKGRASVSESPRYYDMAPPMQAEQRHLAALAASGMEEDDPRFHVRYTNGLGKRFIVVHYPNEFGRYEDQSTADIAKLFHGEGASSTLIRHRLQSWAKRHRCSIEEIRKPEFEKVVSAEKAPLGPGVAYEMKQGAGA